MLDGRRLGYEPAAVVEHASPLTLRKFWRQHVAYGRGAFRYHATQARRGARVRLEPSFYAVAGARGASPAAARGARRAPLLGVWHVANTVGFALEWLARPGAAGARRARGRHGASRDLVRPDRGHRALPVDARPGSRGGRGRRPPGLLPRRARADRRPARGGRAGEPARRTPGGPVRARSARLAATLRAHAARRRAPPHAFAGGPRDLARGAAGRHARSTPSIPRAPFEPDRKFDLLYRLLRLTGRDSWRRRRPWPSAIERHGVDPARIAVVAAPADDARGSPRRFGALSGGTVGVVARLEPQKRVDLFVDVVAELRRRGVSCSGIVVGDGSERAGLIARRDRAGLSGCDSARRRARGRGAMARPARRVPHDLRVRAVRPDRARGDGARRARSWPCPARVVCPSSSAREGFCSPTGRLRALRTPSSDCSARPPPGPALRESGYALAERHSARAVVARPGADLRGRSLRSARRDGAEPRSCRRGEQEQPDGGGQQGDHAVQDVEEEAAAPPRARHRGGAAGCRAAR